MNLIDFYNNRVPKYYDELKINDEVMFIYEGKVESIMKKNIEDYLGAYNVLHKISDIKNRKYTCCSYRCSTGYICIAIESDYTRPNLCFSYLSSCGFMLVNKLGQKLKTRE